MRCAHVKNEIIGQFRYFSINKLFHYYIQLKKEKNKELHY